MEQQLYVVGNKFLAFCEHDNIISYSQLLNLLNNNQNSLNQHTTYFHCPNNSVPEEIRKYFLNKENIET